MKRPKKISIKYYLDKRIELENGLHPVYLQVAYNRKNTKMRSIDFTSGGSPISMTEEEFKGSDEHTSLKYLEALIKAAIRFEASIHGDGFHFKSLGYRLLQYHSLISGQSFVQVVNFRVANSQEYKPFFKAPIRILLNRTDKKEEEYFFTPSELEYMSNELKQHHGKSEAQKVIDDLIKAIPEKAYLLDLRSLEVYLGGISRRTILRMNKEKSIKLYKMRGKLYAKKHEIIHALENGLLQADK